jgi:predicted HD superfamily hydrolase involved in NAD metabolism
MNLQKYQRYIRERVDEARYQHSLDVMEAMLRAASIYGLDANQAQLTGLLHDAEKNSTATDMLRTIQRCNPKLLKDLPEYCYVPTFLHGRAAACTLPRDLGIDDPQILDAVARHAGDAELSDLSLLTRCIHVADMTAPTNSFRGEKKLANLFFSGQLDAAHLLLSHYMLDSCPCMGIPIHPSWKKNMRLLMKHTGPMPDAFFSRD